MAGGFGNSPAGKPLSQWIQQRDTAFGIGRDHGVTDGVKCDGEFFLMLMQGDIGQLELFVGLRLRIDQVAGFDKHLTFNPML